MQNSVNAVYSRVNISNITYIVSSAASVCECSDDRNSAGRCIIDAEHVICDWLVVIDAGHRPNRVADTTVGSVLKLDHKYIYKCKVNGISYTLVIKNLQNE